MQGMQKEMDSMCETVAEFELVINPKIEAEKKELEHRVSCLENELNTVSWL